MWLRKRKSILTTILTIGEEPSMFATLERMIGFMEMKRHLLVQVDNWDE